MLRFHTHVAIRLTMIQSKIKGGVPRSKPASNRLGLTYPGLFRRTDLGVQGYKKIALRTVVAGRDERTELVC